MSDQTIGKLIKARKDRISKDREDLTRHRVQKCFTTIRQDETKVAGSILFLSGEDFDEVLLKKLIKEQDLFLHPTTTSSGSKFIVNELPHEVIR
jgi:hypothetical protein